MERNPSRMHSITVEVKNNNDDDYDNDDYNDNIDDDDNLDDDGLVDLIITELSEKRLLLIYSQHDGNISDSGSISDSDDETGECYY